jgi:hypothetical protein
MTALTANVENVKLGACDVKWGTDDLGVTKGGVQVTINTPTKEIQVDQFGPTAVNEYIQGRSVMVKVPMAESDLQKLALAIPNAQLVTDATTPSKMKLVINNDQGVNLRSLAKKLVLHPSGLAADSKNEDTVIPLAAPSGQIDYAYSFDNERVYNVTFKGYPDNTTGEIAVLGDESAAAA